MFVLFFSVVYITLITTKYSSFLSCMLWQDNKSFFVLIKAYITILVALELCTLSQYQISDCGTIHLFWFLIQALHSTTYTVNFTTIQCRQNFGYASFNSYSFHFSLYSSSTYFSFEHCKLSTYCACAFQMSVYCSHTLCKLSVYCE